MVACAFFPRIKSGGDLTRKLITNAFRFEFSFEVRSLVFWISFRFWITGVESHNSVSGIISLLSENKKYWNNERDLSDKFIEFRSRIQSGIWLKINYYINILYIYSDICKPISMQIICYIIYSVSLIFESYK